MNWVPGNLHLIGKDNQNNPPPLPNKVKTSSCPPPTLSLQACRDTGGGEADKCCTHLETQLLQKDSHSKTILFFLLFRCTSYLSHNLKWQDNMVRWHFQLSPRVSPQRPWTWRSPDCSWRGGHSLPNADICPPCTLSSHQTVHILNKGVKEECESGREPPEP